jgi:O-antigen biosynthesis protein
VIIGVASGDILNVENHNIGGSKWGGSGWARVGQYLDFFPFRVEVGILVWLRTHFVVAIDGATVSDKGIDGPYVEPDIVILQRLMHAGLGDNIKKARAAGQKIINDIDDWYWGLDPRNNAFKHSHPRFNSKENVNHYKSILASSDVVTVSTPYLRDRVAPFVKGDLVLMENTVDINRFTQVKHLNSSIPVLGWAGSTAHRSGDLETVASVLQQLSRNKEVQLMHVGHHSNATSFAERIGVPTSSVRTHPLVSAQEYPSALTMDIGVVPLRVAPFNQAKSDIKGLEYSAAGIPFVAQRIDSYNSLKDSLGVGRVCKKPMDWLKNIRQLQDPVLRQAEGSANRERIKPRDISHGAKRWNELLGAL